MGAPKVLSFGELLIDFYAEQPKNNAATVYQQYAGGAPANVAVVLARLGASSYFVGRVGKDMFGDFLVSEMKARGVRMDYCAQPAKVMTSLAFVGHDQAGERHFQFYRDPRTAADLSFTQDDWQDGWFQDARYFHCGSNCQVTESGHLATQAGMQMARRHNVAVSYDPNLRAALWQDEAMLMERTHALFPFADLIKMSAEELHILFTQPQDEAVHQLLGMGCQLVIITRGPEGCIAYHQDKKIQLDGIRCATVDTTAAGDTFIGAFLYALATKGLAPQDAWPGLEDALNFANRAAALSTTRRGAASSAPSLDEVRQF